MILVALGEHGIAPLNATMAASEDMGSTPFGRLGCIILGACVPSRL